MANQKALTAAKNKLKNAKKIAEQNSVWMFRPEGMNYNTRESVLKKQYWPKLWMTDIDWWFIHNALEKPDSFVQKWLDTLYNKWKPSEYYPNGVQYKTETGYPWRWEFWWTNLSASKKWKNTLRWVSLSFEWDSPYEAYTEYDTRSNWWWTFDAKKMPTPSDSKKVSWAKLNLADVKKRLRKTAELAGNVAKKAVKAIF